MVTRFRTETCMFAARQHLALGEWANVDGLGVEMERRIAHIRNLCSEVRAAFGSDFPMLNIITISLPFRVGFTDLGEVSVGMMK